MAIVVVIDDEPRQAEIIRTILEEENYEVHTAFSGEEGLKLINMLSPDVVLSDLKLSGMSGTELLDNLPDTPVKPAFILMTAYGTIQSAVEAMKKGAFDYLTKPLDRDLILHKVREAAEKINLQKENKWLRYELYNKFKIEGIVSSSKKMEEVLNIIKKVTPTSVTVLIYGESGTGKELIARAIHYNSPRRTGPFTVINCAAIPENLIESELFGYEPGSFTGATHRKIGLFEASDKGTLFLDEVGDLPLLTQTKILRVLQDKEIRRIGSKNSIKVDVRIIAATNKLLEKEVSAGRFREDLFYRLKVVTVELPPLRERKEDIPALVKFFIDKYNKEFGKRIKDISEGAKNALMEYPWPGNIRQLESIIERAVLMCDKDIITTNDIKTELKLPQAEGVLDSLDFDIPEKGINFEELEKELIKKAMAKSNNVATNAAKLLGMSYKTFWYRLEKFGLRGSSPKGDIHP